LPDFFLIQYTKMGKIYQMTTKTPNCYKIKQMATKHVHQMVIKVYQFSIPRPSEMYQNWGIWYVNIPSGNPGRERTTADSGADAACQLSRSLITPTLHP
jgi:hypothetical protein